MELDAVDRQLAVAHGHHLAVRRRRRDLEHVRDRASPRASGSGRPRSPPAGRRRARARRGATGARLPVHELARLADLAAEGLDDRLVAEADAERRHAGASRRTISTVAPASPGRPGPGEITRCDGASRSASSASSSSLRRTHDLGAELAEEVGEVVRERVVVVDQQDHERRLRELDRRLQRGELAQALLVLGRRIRVGDDAGAGLQVARLRRGARSSGSRCTCRTRRPAARSRRRPRTGRAGSPRARR